jgi:hypothetical protein
MKKIFIFILLIFSFKMYAQPVNDNPCSAQPLTVITNDPTLSTQCTPTDLYTWVGATHTYGPVMSGPPCIFANDSLQDVWFSIIMPATGSVSLNTNTGVAFSLEYKFALFSANNCNGPFTQLGSCAGVSNGGDYPFFSINNQPQGSVIYLRIWRRGSSSAQANGDIKICVAMTAPTPDNNFVGVGISAPQYKLDVNGQLMLRQGGYFKGNFDGIGLAGISTYQITATQISTPVNSIVNFGNRMLVNNNTIGIGSSNSVGGVNTTAIGTDCFASGNNSTAMGNFVSNNNKSGSFIIGDREPNANTSQVFGNDANNQMLMRFVGGYKLYTAGWGSTIGAELLPGSTSWSTLSDKRRKENFMLVNGELILEKIKNFNLTTWNYKKQDVKTQRHYGPMAQDFYAAFGTDGLGKIGCDTLINEHDFSSINFIAIQALEKRTQKINVQQQQIENLQKENEILKIRLKKLEKIIYKN